ncbi:hypothetical protein [Actinokineospora enzanensis]|uniref:hypothetical protein n=1 Tax=Actinokineospora enzanensis TaxID=155975 RepID=UPI000381C350|nr:hypothetical protein [Actinokineospora enzanensis]
MDLPEPLPGPARPNRARRAVAIAAGLAVLVGAILVLRTPPDESKPTSAPPPPPQTTVKQYAADNVVVPTPGPRPQPPGKIAVQPGAQRLQLRWGAKATNVPEPQGAVGYEVSWGRAGSTEFTRLVAQPSIQLDALTDGTPYDVAVRTVDSYGQRSEPAHTTATPGAAPDAQPYTFADHFTSRVIPDPVNWRMASNDCARATRGEGEDGTHLVVSGQCSNDPAVLRARPPFRLRDTPVDGELGRLVIETDHPSMGGELQLDLVPGAADEIAGSPNGPPLPGEPGRAVDDVAMPPGAIRIRLAAEPEQTRVQVVVAPGTPRLGAAVPIDQSAPCAEIGMSVRWEVVFRVDGVRVLRDGVVVGGGDVAPAWREATALFGFVGNANGLYAGVSMIGFVGAPTTAPVLVVPPPVDPGRVVVAPQADLATSAGGTRLTGNQGAQIRLALIPQNAPGEPADDTYTVEIGGASFPARPAVVGQPMIRGVHYPIVVDVPADSLVFGPDGRTLVLRVHGPQHEKRAATRVVSASVELIAPEGATSPQSGAGTEAPLPRPRPALARPAATFYDAAGNPIGENTEVARGRLVLEVRTDGAAGQRVNGRLAGLAGVEVRLDGNRIAGIPTTVDGPGAGGVWRLALSTTGLPPGKHTTEIKLISVDGTVAFAVHYASFQVAG